MGEEGMCDTRCFVSGIPLHCSGNRTWALLSGNPFYPFPQGVVWGIHHSVPPSLGQVWDSWRQSWGMWFPSSLVLQGRCEPENWHQCEAQRWRGADVCFSWVFPYCFSPWGKEPEKWYMRYSKQNIIFNDLERFSTYPQMRKKESPNEFWDLDLV